MTTVLEREASSASERQQSDRLKEFQERSQEIADNFLQTFGSDNPITEEIFVVILDEKTGSFYGNSYWKRPDFRTREPKIYSQSLPHQLEEGRTAAVIDNLTGFRGTKTLVCPDQFLDKIKENRQVLGAEGSYRLQDSKGRFVEAFATGEMKIPFTQ